MGVSNKATTKEEQWKTAVPLEWRVKLLSVDFSQRSDVLCPTRPSAPPPKYVKMTIDFYYFLPSPFCRSVLLTARALGLSLNLKETNVWEGEQNKPEFVALNPQHSVPTLVDGDVTLWESRAICTYLASRYSKDDSLYPQDPKVRARIDALLYFDMGTLWPRFRNTISASPTQESLDQFHEALGWLDGFLGRGRFAAGTDHVTVADHVLVANVASFEAAGRLPGTGQKRKHGDALPFQQPVSRKF
ncbi:GST [Penaeus vannamei]|uniref:GST (Mitochondrion) n=1 Tax=Penaeus vannamei TaxID=6689 RepID=A0A3R7SMK5_PENVA|nr:GST [Penaeus vannamei]